MCVFVCVCEKIDRVVVVVASVVAVGTAVACAKPFRLCSLLLVDVVVVLCPSYSSELSVSSCFNTFVCDVSRISPAKNISSTTVYTL